jgi:putative tricarboxylic transport membrane protein
MSQGEIGIMWANPLVGTITTLALLMLFWPLITKLIALVRTPKVKPAFADEQPVD